MKKPHHNSTRAGVSKRSYIAGLAVVLLGSALTLAAAQQLGNKQPALSAKPVKQGAPAAVSGASDGCRFTRTRMYMMMKLASMNPGTKAPVKSALIEVSVISP